MRAWISLLILVGCPLLDAAPSGVAGKLLYADDFRHGLTRWVVEQQPGGSVTVEDGRLLIKDAAGCTVWLRAKLNAPVLITYTAQLSAASRVSDLNCFWMANDPARPDDLFAAGHGRAGKFTSYDSLQTYYVGYGGNNNTTTRFRRYDGSGTRPLLPEYDLSAPEFLLQAGHAYRIALLATADGRVQFSCDDRVVFDWHDPAPLRAGWFGFRTVHSQIEISDFQVHAAVTPAGEGGR
jgi:hypothetical protein